MKYVLIRPVELFILSLATGIISSLIIVAYMMLQEYQKLPIVVTNGSDICIKVLNVENGHAFGCQDVNVLLRRYRVKTE